MFHSLTHPFVEPPLCRTKRLIFGRDATGTFHERTRRGIRTAFHIRSVVSARRRSHLPRQNINRPVYGLTVHLTHDVPDPFANTGFHVIASLR